MAGIVRQGDNLWFTAADDDPDGWEQQLLEPMPEAPAPKKKPVKSVAKPKPPTGVGPTSTPSPLVESQPKFQPDTVEGSGVFPNSNKFKTPANQINKTLSGIDTNTKDLEFYGPHAHPGLENTINKYPAFAKTYFKPSYQDALKSYMGLENYNKLLQHMPKEHHHNLTNTEVSQAPAPKSNKFTIPFNSLKKHLDADDADEAGTAGQWMESHPAVVKTYLSTPKYHDAIKQHIGEHAYKALLDGMSKDQYEAFTGKKPEHKPLSGDALDEAMEINPKYGPGESYKEWKSQLSPEELLYFTHDPESGQESFHDFLYGEEDDEEPAPGAGVTSNDLKSYFDKADPGYLRAFDKMTPEQKLSELDSYQKLYLDGPGYKPENEAIEGFKAKIQEQIDGDQPDKSSQLDETMKKFNYYTDMDDYHDWKESLSPEQIAHFSDHPHDAATDFDNFLVGYYDEEDDEDPYEGLSEADFDSAVFDQLGIHGPKGVEKYDQWKNSLDDSEMKELTLHPEDAIDLFADFYPDAGYSEDDDEQEQIKTIQDQLLTDKIHEIVPLGTETAKTVEGYNDNQKAAYLKALINSYGVNSAEGQALQKVLDEFQGSSSFVPDDVNPEDEGLPSSFNSQQFGADFLSAIGYPGNSKLDTWGLAPEYHNHHPEVPNKLDSLTPKQAKDYLDWKIAHPSDIDQPSLLQALKDKYFPDESATEPSPQQVGTALAQALWGGKYDYSDLANPEAFLNDPKGQLEDYANKHGHTELGQKAKKILDHFYPEQPPEAAATDKPLTSDGKFYVPSDDELNELAKKLGLGDGTKHPMDWDKPGMMQENMEFVLNPASEWGTNENDPWYQFAKSHLAPERTQSAPSSPSIAPEQVMQDYLDAVHGTTGHTSLSQLGFQKEWKSDPMGVLEGMSQGKWPDGHAVSVKAQQAAKDLLDKYSGQSAQAPKSGIDSQPVTPNGKFHIPTYEQFLAAAGGDGHTAKAWQANAENTDWLEHYLEQGLKSNVANTKWGTLARLMQINDAGAVQQDADHLEAEGVKGQQTLESVNDTLHHMFPDSKWDDNQSPEQAIKTLDFLINNLDPDDYPQNEIDALKGMKNSLSANASDTSEFDNWIDQQSGAPASSGPPLPANPDSEWVSEHLNPGTTAADFAVAIQNVLKNTNKNADVGTGIAKWYNFSNFASDQAKNQSAAQQKKAMNNVLSDTGWGGYSSSSSLSKYQETLKSNISKEAEGIDNEESGYSEENLHKLKRLYNTYFGWMDHDDPTVGDVQNWMTGGSQPPKSDLDKLFGEFDQALAQPSAQSAITPEALNKAIPGVASSWVDSFVNSPPSKQIGMLNDIQGYHLKNSETYNAVGELKSQLMAADGLKGQGPTPNGEQGSTPAAEPFDPKPSLDWMQEHYPQTSDWDQAKLDDWYDKASSGEYGNVPALNEWNKYQDFAGGNYWDPEDFQKAFKHIIDAHGKTSGSSLYNSNVTPQKAYDKLKSMLENTPSDADPALTHDLKALFHAYFGDGIPQEAGQPYKFPDSVGQYDVIPKAPAKPLKSEPMDPEDFIHYEQNKPSNNSDWNDMAQWWAATQVPPEAEVKLYTSWFPNKPPPSPEQANDWFKAVFDQFSEPADEDLSSNFTPAWAHADWAFGDNADQEWPLFKQWATTDPDLPIMNVVQKMHVWKDDLSADDKAALAEDYSSETNSTDVIKALKTAFPDSNFTKWKNLSPGEMKNSLANLVKGGFVEAADIYEHFYGERLEPPAPAEDAEGNALAPSSLTSTAPVDLPDWANDLAKKGNPSALNDHMLTSKLLDSLGAGELNQKSNEDMGYYQKMLLRRVRQAVDKLSGNQKKMIQATPVDQLPWFQEPPEGGLGDESDVGYKMSTPLTTYLDENPDTSTWDALSDILGSPSGFSPSSPQSLVPLLDQMDPHDKFKVLQAYHDQFEHDKPTLAEYLSSFAPDTDWNKILQSSDHAQVLKLLKKNIKSADTADKYVGFANALAKYFPKSPTSNYDVANSGDKLATSVLKPATPGYGLSTSQLQTLGNQWMADHGDNSWNYDPEKFKESDSHYNQGQLHYAPYVGWTPPGDTSGGFKLDPAMFAKHKSKKYQVPDIHDLDSDNNAFYKELVSNAHLDRDVTWSGPKFRSELAEVLAPTIQRMNPQQQKSFSDFLGKATPQQAKVWVGEMLDHPGPEEQEAWQRYQLEQLYDKYFTGSGYSPKDKSILASSAFKRFFNAAPKDYQETMALHPGRAVDDFQSVLEGTLSSDHETLPRQGDAVFKGTRYPYTTSSDRHAVSSGKYKGHEAYTVHTGPNSTFEYIPYQALTGHGTDTYEKDRSQGEHHWPGFSHNPQRNDSNRTRLVKPEKKLLPPGQQDLVLPPGQSIPLAEKPILLHRGVGLNLGRDLEKAKSFLLKGPPKPPDLKNLSPASASAAMEDYRRKQKNYSLNSYRRNLLQQINYLLKGSSFKDEPDLFNTAGESSEGFVPVPNNWDSNPPHGPAGVMEFNKWVTNNNVPDEQVYDLAQKWGLNNPEDYGVPGITNGPWTEGLASNPGKSKSTQLSDLLAEYLSVTDFQSGEGYAPPDSFGDHWTANESPLNGTAERFADTGGGDMQVLTSGLFNGEGEKPDSTHAIVGFGDTIDPRHENEIAHSPGAPFDLMNMYVRARGHGIPEYIKIPVRRQRRYAKLKTAELRTLESRIDAMERLSSLLEGNIEPSEYTVWRAEDPKPSRLEKLKDEAQDLKGVAHRWKHIAFGSIDKEEIGDIEEAIERLAYNDHDIAEQAAISAEQNALANAQLAQQVSQIELQLSGGTPSGGSPMNMYNQVNNASGYGVPNLCPPGSYYDPVHQICQPNLTSTPESGYGQACPDGYVYDPVHGVCTNHMNSEPSAYYPR